MNVYQVSLMHHVPTKMGAGAVSTELYVVAVDFEDCCRTCKEAWPGNEPTSIRLLSTNQNPAVLICKSLKKEKQ